MTRSSTAMNGLAILSGAAAGAAVFYWLGLRPWHIRWGATADEVASSWPGDELIPVPRVAATHAVTIQASPDKVWPWLVQIGQGRGGFYSYEVIENAMGLDISNADRILPQYQELHVGDVVPLAPDGAMDVPVVICQPQQALVLHGDTRIPGGKGAPPVKPGEFLAVSWGFHLVDRGGATRLVERFRLDYTPTALNSLIYRLFLEGGAFVMERKMLLGIQSRAERL